LLFIWGFMCSMSQFRNEYFVWLGEKSKKFLNWIKKVLFFDNHMEKLDFFVRWRKLKQNVYWREMIGGIFFFYFHLWGIASHFQHVILIQKDLTKSSEIVILGPTLGDGSLISGLDFDESMRKLKEWFDEMAKTTDGRPL
jgi:hypothetical protein